MFRMRRALPIVGALLLTIPTSHAAGEYNSGEELFHFDDAELTESSGVVASSVREGVYFTHNDSGDVARFFAVDRYGCTLARYTLGGVDQEAFAAAHDVEDIARGVHEGQPVLWLADIGDNLHQRPEVSVWRVAEPNVNNSSHRSSASCPTTSEEVVETVEYRLVYPDTPHDAETLVVDPANGQLLIATKTPVGQTSIYAAPLDLVPASGDGTVNALELVTAFEFPPSATYDKDPATELGELLASRPDAPYTQPGFDLQGRLSSTGGDIAPDRSRIVIRTYTDAWEWDLGQRTIAEALAGVPLQIPLHYQRQGEAITYTRNAGALVTTCEDVGCVAHIYRGPTE